MTLYIDKDKTLYREIYPPELEGTLVKVDGELVEELMSYYPHYKIKSEDNVAISVVFDEESYNQSMENAIDPEPTQLDRIEAQIAYTAMMTDTLLEV